MRITNQQHPPELWQKAIADAFDRGFAAGQLGRLSLEAEVARLREEGIEEYHALTETIAQTFPVHDGEEAEVALYQRAVTTACKRIASLTTTLLFYADKESYVYGLIPRQGGIAIPVLDDGGARARLALAVDEDGIE